jgi:hypothetical protein
VEARDGQVGQVMVMGTAAVALASGVLSGDVNPQGPDPTNISPGLVGFLATFGLVLAAIALFFSMTRHLRKVDYARRQAEAGNNGAGALGNADGAAPEERAEESSLESPGVADAGGELGDEERDRPNDRA